MTKGFVVGGGVVPRSAVIFAQNALNRMAGLL
jgi:hypothetical protein